MNLKNLFLVIISIILLLIAGRCLQRPPWPGAGDETKDRTSEIQPIKIDVSEFRCLHYYRYYELMKICGKITASMPGG